MAPYDADVETARKLTDDHAWGPWTQLTVRERQLRDSIATIASLTQRLQEQEAECARRKAQYDDIQREIFNSHTEYETQLTALQASHDALLDAVKIYRVAPIRTFPVIRAIDTAIATAEKLRGHTDDKPNKNC
jgi:multidrug efflux pump subunit AcrA (membrane-fusion protein)